VDHYAVLGLPRGASLGQIREAGDASLRNYRPTLIRKLFGPSETEIRQAIRVLGSAESRLEYDNYLDLMEKYGVGSPP
jgi:curved DNA-binding protein CbpA